MERLFTEYLWYQYTVLMEPILELVQIGSTTWLKTWFKTFLKVLETFLTLI
jgi:hypothetical protein